jgi:nucleoid-associated protein YgaU
MSLQDKYKSVLDLGQKLEIKDGSVEEVDGLLKVRGKASTQYHKNLLWDEIKKAGGDSPSDIMADISVENLDYFHRHIVQKGDTLGKISKTYYGKAGKYMHIFNANTDILKDPNMIHPDQDLVIPFPED